MSKAPPSLVRLQELLADQSLFGLDDAEAAELEQLLIAFPQIDRHELDRIVLGLEIRAAEKSQIKMPDLLAQRILRQMKDAPSHDPPLKRNSTRNDTEKLRGSPHDTLPIQSAPSRPASHYAGWLVAAACLLLAAVGWLRPIKSDRSQAPSPMAAREALIQASRETILCSWQPQKDPSAVNADGDVVWNEAKQEGYMRFRNLAANNPANEQYQLWIFDASQDAATPIDGGVFDIPAGQEEVVVPIRAKLQVQKAAMFAITVEKPGGVVVSKRERLPLLAQVAAK
jgi:Anti-sigma-K factor rskA